MDDLTLPRLRAFLAVAEERSFTRAATRLRVAQQALSNAVRRLERDLGARLLERSTRSVALTPAGLALSRRARVALDELARGLVEARRVGRLGKDALAVGVLPGAALELTAPILAAFSAQASGAEVVLEPHEYDDPSAGLRGGATHVAVLRPPLDRRGLTLAPLFCEPRLVALSATHPLAARPSLTMAELRAVDVVRPASPDPLWNHFWAAGCARVVESRTPEQSIELVAAGRAVAITTAGWARLYAPPQVRVVEVLGLSPSEVSLAWREGEADPRVHRFVDVARATARARPSLLRSLERPRHRER